MYLDISREVHEACCDRPGSLQAKHASINRCANHDRGSQKSQRSGLLNSQKIRQISTKVIGRLENNPSNLAPQHPPPHLVDSYAERLAGVVELPARCLAGSSGSRTPAYFSLRSVSFFFRAARRRPYPPPPGAWLQGQRGSSLCGG